MQQQRTVYRLTLVKAWNVEELKAYAELVSLGQPDFIEVKVSCGLCGAVPPLLEQTPPQALAGRTVDVCHEQSLPRTV